MPQTLYEYGGHGSVIHMAVANGFPPQTYAPLLQPLAVHYRVLSFPPRPLWDAPPAPHTQTTWEIAANDLLDALDAYHLAGVIGVGHSLGGVATLIAATKAPERFKGIILLDPTIFPQPYLLLMAAMRAVGLQGRAPLVKKALQRRARFESEHEAFEYWRGKRLFRDWSDDMLWLYVNGMTQPAAEGGLELRWSPEWEAQVYATVYTRAWARVRQLRGLMPVLVIRATESNTFFEPAAKRMRRMLPNMSYAEIPGHGHLFPQSAPDETRAIIEAWLERERL